MGGGHPPLFGGPLEPDPRFRGAKINSHEDGALKITRVRSICATLRAARWSSSPNSESTPRNLGTVVFSFCPVSKKFHTSSQYFWPLSKTAVELFKNQTIFKEKHANSYEVCNLRLVSLVLFNVVACEGCNFRRCACKVCGCQPCNLRSLVLRNVVACFAKPHVRGATYDGMLAKFVVSMGCSR